MILDYPPGLVSLIGIPIIIVLHLLRERRQRIPISSLRLWSFLQVEVHGSRPKRFPITWLLLCDLLIMALIGLALAKPKIPRLLMPTEARQLVILLDVSSSMQSKDVLPDRFTQAKIVGSGLLGSVGSNDIVTLITFGKGPHWIGDSREMDFTDLLSRFSKIQPGEIGHSLEAALSMGAASLADLPVEFHVLTDAAYPDPNLSQYPYPITLHFFGSVTTNQTVLDISTSTDMNARNQIFAHLVNFGPQAVKRMVTLLVDGDPVDSVTLTLPAGEVVSQIWENIQGQHANFAVTLIGSDALKEDDTAWIGNPPVYNPRILLVSNSSGPLERALHTVGGGNFRKIAPRDYSEMSSAGVTVFQDYLPDAWPEGVSMVVDPPQGDQILKIGDFQEITLPVQIQTDDPILQGAELTGVRWQKTRALNVIPAGFQTVMKAGNHPILLNGLIGFSRVYVLLSDTQSGNLTNHPGFRL